MITELVNRTGARVISGGQHLEVIVIQHVLDVELKLHAVFSTQLRLVRQL